MISPSASTVALRFVLSRRDLSPARCVEIGEELRKWVKDRARHTRSEMIEELNIPRKRFYFFLTIGSWSKRIKNLIKGNNQILSQSALLRYSHSKWIDARQLFNALSKEVERLKIRKRRTLDLAIKVAKEYKDKISFQAKKARENVKIKVYEFRYNHLLYGQNLMFKDANRQKGIDRLISNPYVFNESITVDGEPLKTAFKN